MVNKEDGRRTCYFTKYSRNDIPKLKLYCELYCDFGDSIYVRHTKDREGL